MIKSRSGFTVFEALIALVILGVLVGGFMYIKQKNESKYQANAFNASNESNVTWEFNQSNQKWISRGGIPPTCPRPLLSQSPVNTTLATSLHYPGQYRGNQYKTDGGFRFDNSKNSDIEVEAPMDGSLVSIVRYVEANETQYLLSVIHPCGIMYSFDHLLSLSPKFDGYAQQTPPAKVDDTMSNFKFKPSPKIKAGELIAISSGHTNNVSIDFGVYDLRSPNEISKNSQWAALHSSEAEQTFYGVCWFDLLPTSHRERVSNLQSGDFSSRAISDYCKNSARTTLQVNDGNPPQN